MKTIAYIFIAIFLIPTLIKGQEREIKSGKFVNQTEIALLMGRTLEYEYSHYPYYSSYYPGPGGWLPRPSTKKANTGSFSIQTFNGWRVKPRTTLGVTAGLDAYQGALIMPLAIGARQILFEKGPTLSKIQASLDVGSGTLWLDGDQSDSRSKKGGIMINPAVGFVFPTRSGSAFLLNFGYKYQRYTVSETYSETNFMEESRNISRLQIRLGFQF